MNKIFNLSMLVILFAIGEVNAQTFGTAQINPFGIAPENHYFSRPQLVDFDMDGDLDLFDTYVDPNTQQFGISYQENIGDSSSPIFDEREKFKPTSKFSNMFFPSPADLDGDGDFDMVVFDYFNQKHAFYELQSITPINNIFGPKVSDPFNLIAEESFSQFHFLDLDNDGDLDALIPDTAGNILYYPNIGTVSDPDYDDAWVNPFGLTNNGNDAQIAHADMDLDMDLDLLIGTNDGLFYMENIGTAVSPQFALAVNDPFSISYSFTIPSPYLADIDFDGDMDLFVGDSPNTGKVIYFENLSVPTFLESNNSPGFLNVYPNPSSGFVSISMSQKFVYGSSYLIVENTLGEIVMEQRIESEFFTLNLGQLDPGLYTFSTIGTSQKLFEKIIIY